MKFMPSRYFDRMSALLPALALALAGLFVGTPGAARSQSASLSDPPGRVARLSDVGGQVWLYSPDSGEWVSAVRNRPLTSGDRLATDTGSRAELQVGATTVRLAAGTELEVRTLDDNRFSLQLHSGGVAVRLRDPADAAEFELATEDGRFLAPRAGRYRFDRDATGSFVTVYAGQARYEGPNSGLTIAAGQRAEFWIDAAGAAQYRLGAPQTDAFAAWADERDRVADRSVSTRYVSPAMTGTEDLDRYGRWEQDAEYGSLWMPIGVAVDWAPYSTGHWVWVRPWGWTWVDEAPWGFAPFHYGRWVHRHNAWGWAPGQRAERPVYAPALVGWVGGPGVSVSISIGGGREPAPVVGWFPLAPSEVYVPSYVASPLYAQNINITNVTNITQITTVINNPQAPREFTNRRFPNAVTVVPAAVMTSRQPVAPAAAQLRDTPWVRDVARQPAGGTVLVAAPVTAPVAPARRTDGKDVKDMRAVVPAPGAAPLPGASPADGRPTTPPRGREGVRLPPTAVSPVAPRSPTPPTASTVPVPPNAMPAERRSGGARDDGRPDGGVQRPPPPAAPTPGRPAPDAVSMPRPVSAPPATAPPATAPRPPVPPVPVQDAPLMRAQPVYRGEERRSEDRRAPVRTEAPAMIEPRLAAPPDRPVPPPRPTEAARPVVPGGPGAPPAVRPVEATRSPPPPPPPEVKRVEAPPRPHSEPPKDVREDRRDDKRVEPRERDTR